jgi:hypothetical protein
VRKTGCRTLSRGNIWQPVATGDEFLAKHQALDELVSLYA